MRYMLDTRQNTQAVWYVFWTGDVIADVILQMAFKTGRMDPQDGSNMGERELKQLDLKFEETRRNIRTENWLLRWKEFKPCC